MTHARKPAPRLAALPAAIAALLLVGCSSGHIGDSWQCPLAKGGACDSVAAADPAVPDAGAARKKVLTEPLWRVRPAERDAPTEPPCATACGANRGGFDPFGWLMRLFRAEAGESETGTPDRTARKPEPATAAKAGTLPAGPDRGADAAVSAAVPEATEPGPAEPKAAALPAEPVSTEGGSQSDDLRTGDVVARIWIAPFVDAQGVYREASWVRVVLEPAGWRFP